MFAISTVKEVEVKPNYSSTRGKAGSKAFSPWGETGKDVFKFLS